MASLRIRQSFWPLGSKQNKTKRWADVQACHSQGSQQNQDDEDDENDDQDNEEETDNEEEMKKTLNGSRGDQTTGNWTYKNQGMFHFKQVICGAASG